MSNVKKPEPFGYARDGNLGGSLVFQHKISEMEALASSTMPLYSPDQMDSYAAERVREALKNAAKELERRRNLLIKQNVVLDIKEGVAMYDLCAGAIRALIPTQ